MAALPVFLSRTMSGEDCVRRIRHGLEHREANFLTLVERGIYAVPSSPYLQLLRHAGIEQPELSRLVLHDGVEGALSALYAAGVRLSLEEFKRRQPIRRGSLVIEAAPHAFDNPLAARHLDLQTGGSTGAPARIYLDLSHYAQDAAYDYAFLWSHGLEGRPFAVWRPTPPWGAGIKGVLGQAKLGRRTERWFTQRPFDWRARGRGHTALTAYAVLAGRAVGRPLPWPEHVPLQAAGRIAAWLGQQAARGRPAVVSTNAASAVRACMAATAAGIPIDGTLFRCGGEPLTRGKLEVIAAAGARAVCHYSMSEIGRVGTACADPEAADEVHLMTDKLAVLQRPRAGHDVNIYTTLLPTTPKLLLNVDSDDYGVLGQRRCGCGLAELGFGLHLHTIRSVEKLTSEGMTFIGDDLVRLVEEELPRRFGGGATDWQLVEEEEQGLPRVSVVASERLGALDEPAVVGCVLGFLNRIPGASDDYGDRWRAAGTLRLRRAEPFVTGSSKVLPLHSTRHRDRARPDA